MKPSLPLLATLALASCQTTGASTDAAKEFANFPVTCPWRATFPGNTEFLDESSRPDVMPGSSRLVVRSKGDYRQFAVVCFCNPKFNLSRLSRTDAEAMNDGALQAEKWKRTSSNFRETGSRKEFEYSATADMFAGNFVRKGRSHYQGTCATTVEAVAPVSDTQAVDRFIQSIRDVRDVTAPSAAVPPTPSTESRLSTLKDLLDRKVITQQEHDDRRRAILGSL